MLTLLLLTLACDSSSSSDELGPDDQLESVAVAHDYAPGLYTDVELAGALAVSGSDKDWVLELSSPDLDEPVHLTVHSPGGADLAPLAGASVLALLPGDWFAEHYSLLLTDEDGPLYVLDMGLHADQTNAFFGDGFVSHGTIHGEDKDNTWKTSYTSVAFDTDSGVVELLPGEVRTITVDGQPYRAAAISAWTRVAREGASLPGCPVAEELLSYELIRIAAEVEPELIVRPDGLDPASAGCL